jgi:hypothetical protein
VPVSTLCSDAGSIVPDFGFYGRDFHSRQIHEERLIAGVNTLNELVAKAIE